VCERILTAWCSIYPEIVEKSSKATEISNAMDDSEHIMTGESESNDNGNDGSGSE
jgi:hypothetical protein